MNTTPVQSASSRPLTIPKSPKQMASERARVCKFINISKRASTFKKTTKTAARNPTRKHIKGAPKDSHRILKVDASTSPMIFPEISNPVLIPTPKRIGRFASFKRAVFPKMLNLEDVSELGGKCDATDITPLLNNMDKMGIWEDKTTGRNQQAQFTPMNMETLIEDSPRQSSTESFEIYEDFNYRTPSQSSSVEFKRSSPKKQLKVLYGHYDEDVEQGQELVSCFSRSNSFENVMEFDNAPSSSSKSAI